MTIGWQHYECVITERHQQGLLQIAPAAADGAPAEIVRQHAQVGQRLVRFVAAAVASGAGDLPELPAALSFSDAVLLEREINTQSPIPFDPGKYLYIAWGTYTYALINARSPDAAFPVGNLPPSISNLGDAQIAFPSGKFRRFLDSGQFSIAASTQRL